jgi:hypothetical protein
MLVQEGKLARDSCPPQWDEFFQDELVLLQEGKLARANFPLWWDDF